MTPPSDSSMPDSSMPVSSTPGSPGPAPPCEFGSGEVPGYRVDTYREKAADYAVAIFVIDEGEKLLKQLERMVPHTRNLDVIVADGGSTDGSTEEAQLRPRGVRTLLTKTGEGRLSAQMRMAMAWALAEGYRGLVVIDGNGKDGVEALPRFVEALEQGFDHAQGSRFVPGGDHRNTPTSRLWGVRLLHAPLISLAARFRYTDTTNGFRAYSRGLLVDPRVDPFRRCFSAYELHYYLAIRAARLGFRVCELPVSRRYPDSGPVPTKIGGWRGNWKVLRTLVAACLGRFDPKKETPRP